LHNLRCNFCNLRIKKFTLSYTNSSYGVFCNRIVLIPKLVPHWPNTFSFPLEVRRLVISRTIALGKTNVSTIQTDLLVLVCFDASAFFAPALGSAFPPCFWLCLWSVPLGSEAATSGAAKILLCYDICVKNSVLVHKAELKHAGFAETS
jgi:hypothetical protein